MARLQQHYREKVAPELMKQFGYTSPMQVPRLTKITLNMGVSEAVADKKVMDNAVADLTKIAGQKPVVTKAKKAIAGFKIREGQAIGCMVTLRGVRMYEFLDRFVTVALPRVRDFRGVSGRAFDGRFLFSWPNHQIGVMGGDQAANTPADSRATRAQASRSSTGTASSVARRWRSSVSQRAQSAAVTSRVSRPGLAGLRWRWAAFHSATAAEADSGVSGHASRSRGRVRSSPRRPPPYQMGRSPALGRAATEYPVTTSVRPAA